jgi:ribosomal protein L21
VHPWEKYIDLYFGYTVEFQGVLQVCFNSENDKIKNKVLANWTIEAVLSLLTKQSKVFTVH